MSLTLEKGPYVFNVNNTFTESSNNDKCKRMLLELKNELVALGGAGVIWQVVASSDSVSVVNKGGGSPDLWADISDLVYAYNGSPHSWCLLENQTTGSELLLDYNSSAYPAANKVNALCSPSGIYTASGTTTNAPTATDNLSILSSGYQFSDVNTDFKFVLNVMASADHKITRWYWHERNSGTGGTGGMVGFIEEVQNPPSEWNSTIKAATFYHGSGIAVSTLTYNKTPILATIQGNSLRLLYETAEPYSVVLTAYPSCAGYNYFYGDNHVQLAMKIAADLDLMGGYPVNPIGLWRPTNPKGGQLGRFADLYFAPYGHDTLDTYPDDSSRAWVKWGCFLVPWNGTIPLDVT